MGYELLFSFPFPQLANTHKQTKMAKKANLLLREIHMNRDQGEHNFKFHIAETLKSRVPNTIKECEEDGVFLVNSRAQSTV